VLFFKEKMNKKIRPDFLIVGLERSGTHWVAALLNSHPDIACFPTLPWRGDEGGNKIGEVHFFDTLASLEPKEKRGLFTRPFEDFLTKYNKVFADLVPHRAGLGREELYKEFQKRYSDYCDAQRDGKKIVGEGTPAYVFHLDFIDRLYPNIGKICSIRDPKDKIVSWYFNKMVRKGGVSVPNITREFALGYLHERIIPEYEALLNYAGHIHCVTYEALSADTPGVTKSMVKYLGFDVTEAELRHMVEEASFKKQTERDSGSRGREKGEEDAKSGLRKGITGDWKNYLDHDLASEIDSAVAEVRRAVFRKYCV
jgi:hypothetical protein